ncbi:MAG: thiamine pyrophosphate-dependent dehydrogenase E1 component subunit alpha [Christensenella sp.]|uniref:thiamine pyrophosphate-dependent dehydrogenase E1 component subunit alpha n=1 Tax=Christensenella sp. TaxID=1935934 RepID=UPI002B21ADB1|nr:thiamine pyrophosphate-dependent dehydrogenase E1 component subunit alpha [Christensenella sp.]MEA5003049.1 thiamine pyrophosphate-dependent dehydrogenase E1 component subunit alpha [Christensenella sp.]
MQLSKEQKLAIYETMLLIRESELKMMELYKRGEIEGHMLPCLGQEAIPATLAQVYDDKDYLITGHRGGGHYFARGCDYNAFWGEMFGRVTGATRGRGGQIHLMDISKKALTGNAIVGAQWGIAAGAGFVAKRDGAACVCVGGEGSTNRGTFHESMNLAAVQNLPILYVIEFNNRQMWNDCTQTTAVDRLSKRALAYDMQGATVDGNDPDAIFEKASEFMDGIRAGGRPCLLECITNKWTDSVNSARNTPEAIEGFKQPDVDAIYRYETKLKEQGVLTDGLDTQIKERVHQKVMDGVEFGRNSEKPEPTEGMDQVYSQPVV